MKRIAFVLTLLVFVTVFFVVRIEYKTNKLRNASPVLDAKTSASRGDFRFVGVHGYSTSVPGFRNGEANSLIKTHGIKAIEETNDFLVLYRQRELQNLANSYAIKYNLTILSEIMANPDKKTARLIAEAKSELKILENSDPIKDSYVSFNSGNPHFISTSDEILPGIEEPTTDPIASVTPTRLLKSNHAIFSGKLDTRLREVLKGYVSSYNKNLRRLLLQSRRDRR